MENPYPGQETLIVQVGWDPEGRLLAVYQDRIQSWLDLRRHQGTSSRVLVREQSRAWQERLPLPWFLADGGFLWESSRTGHQHLYRYDKEGGLVGAVTTGPWDVRKLHGVDAKAQQVYFDATERSPITLDACRIGLDGKGFTRLTERPGTHRVKFNATFTAFLDTWSDIHTPAQQVYFDATERSPIMLDACRIGLDGKGFIRLTERPGTHRVKFNATFTAFLDTWSDVHTPPQQTLHDGSGQRLRLIDANPGADWKALKLGQVTFQQVRTRDGFLMETMLVRPVDFDPAKKYPVYQYIYGGPAAPLVGDTWNRSMSWFQFLAQHGIATWICDNRSASAKGIASAHGIHRNLGAQELQDQLDGHAWLKAQGWADLDRLCLDGWSYGGYMVTFALTHSKAWKLGIAGAPVVDW